MGWDFRLVQGAASGSGTASGLSVVVIAATAVCVLVLIGVAIPLVIIRRRRRIVCSTSYALRGLSELNGRYMASVWPLPAITMRFNASTTSKAQFDRFELNAFLSTSVLEYEAWVQNEIDTRKQRLTYYSQYIRELSTLGETTLGKSDDQRVREDHYRRVEFKEFTKHVLASPIPTAVVTGTVEYTTPAGRNSYFGRLDWNFAQLEEGLRSARQLRERRGTAEYLRARERSLMTPKLRTDVLRRDGSRCRMCGASSAEGATLHVDHIVPVSHGGRTVMDNLQTLCQSCNLGKSNRFAG